MQTSQKQTTTFSAHVGTRQHTANNTANIGTSRRASLPPHNRYTATDEGSPRRTFCVVRAVVRRPLHNCQPDFRGIHRRYCCNIVVGRAIDSTLAKYAVPELSSTAKHATLPAWMSSRFAANRRPNSCRYPANRIPFSREEFASIICVCVCDVLEHVTRSVCVHLVCVIPYRNHCL